MQNAMTVRYAMILRPTKSIYLWRSFLWILSIWIGSVSTMTFLLQMYWQCDCWFTILDVCVVLDYLYLFDLCHDFFCLEHLKLHLVFIFVRILLRDFSLQSALLVTTFIISIPTLQHLARCGNSSPTWMRGNPCHYFLNYVCITMLLFPVQVIDDIRKVLVLL